MKGISKDFRFYLRLFLITLVLILFYGCNSVNPVTPIIHSFISNVYILEEGDTAILSWEITDANTITINQGIGNVSLSGSTSVSPTETTAYNLTATNGTGTSTATVTITVNPVIIEQKITIQPGPAEGKDAEVNSIAPSDNNGDYDYLHIGKHDGYTRRSFLQFDLSILPEDVIIVDAYLKLFHTNTEDFSISLHQVTEVWEESTITWNNQPDFLSTPENTITIPTDMFTWLSLDITSLLQGWVDGSIDNYGVVLKKDIEMSVTDVLLIECYSSDYMNNSTLCPKLEITYYVS